MKTLKLFATAALLAVGMSANAQFTNASSGGSASVADGWNSVFVEVNPSVFSPKHGDSKSFMGFSVGYNHAFGLSQNVPLYIVTGGALQYSHDNTDQDDYSGYSDWSTSLNMFSLKVPVNLAYRFDLPNSSVSIIPYTGIQFRLNISATSTENFEGDWDDLTEHYAEEVEERDGESINLFDEDDMGGSKATWNRFQIGWYTGVNVTFGKFLVGFEYGLDFSDISKDTSIMGASIRLGYNF